MEPIIIDMKELITAIRLIVKKSPDLVYATPSGTCSYRPTLQENGETRRCIIGQAMHDIGRNIDHVQTGNINHAFNMCNYVPSDKDAMRYCLLIQVLQDRGAPMGRARWTADTAYEIFVH